MLKASCLAPDIVSRYGDMGRWTLHHEEIDVEFETFQSHIQIACTQFEPESVQGTVHGWNPLSDCYCCGGGPGTPG